MSGPTEGDLISTVLMGFWAFLGEAVRSGLHWDHPETGRFSWARFLVAIITALVMGQLASAIGEWQHWESAARCSLASGLGYVGPAAALIMMKRWFGVSDNGKPGV